ncbi:MAG: 4Fe-4S dicluster domain-containing protein [Bacteroidales bacterium]
MNNYYTITKQDWDKTLTNLTNNYDIYAPVKFGDNQDYELIEDELISEIVYNIPKPSTPLKTFFSPIQENVVKIYNPEKKKIIMGIPSCDLAALDIQDEMNLNRDYEDPAYKKHRDNSILIGTDCHSHQEHCHCTTYDVKPYPEKHHDILLSYFNATVYLQTNSEKGESLINELQQISNLKEPTENEIQEIINKRNAIEQELNQKNEQLPDYGTTGNLIKNSGDEIWKKYSETCVSCGACATSCPTCTCFLLLERWNFEKVKHLDACQYPGFEKVAAGEDPLAPLHKRFYNRYMCKYVWKPDGFESTACTGCGRCIEACIGNINKNELFLELKNK